MRRNYLYSILSYFEKFHAPFEDLKVMREVPYEDKEKEKEMGKNERDVIWLNYDYLLVYEQYNEPYFHPVLKKRIPVKEVLDGYRSTEKDLEGRGMTGGKVEEYLEKIAENTGRTAENTSESLELDMRRNELLEQMSTRLRQVLEDIQGSIESMGERLFANADEQRKFYEKMMSKLSDTEKEEVEHIWKKGDIKQKIKFSLPFLIGKYEAEIDLSEKRFPRSWKEFKAWFIEEAK
jgi:hypothetical protein